MDVRCASLAEALCTADHAPCSLTQEAALLFAKNFYGLLLERVSSSRCCPLPASAQAHHPQACSVAVAFLTARNVIAGSYKAAEVDKFLLLPEPSTAAGERYSETWLREFQR